MWGVNIWVFAQVENYWHHLQTPWVAGTRSLTQVATRTAHYSPNVAKPRPNPGIQRGRVFLILISRRPPPTHTGSRGAFVQFNSI
jgi:hypothetical protein